MDIKIYSNSKFLIYEFLNIRTKINYEDINDIIIYYIDDSIYNNKMDIYLNQPVKYELIKKNTISRIIYFFFLLFHKNKYLVEIEETTENLKKIFFEFRKNMKITNSINDFDDSLFWETNEKKYSFKGVKLVYSKNNDTLGEILKNKDRLIE